MGSARGARRLPAGQLLTTRRAGGGCCQVSAHEAQFRRLEEAHALSEARHEASAAAARKELEAARALEHDLDAAVLRTAADATAAHGGALALLGGGRVKQVGRSRTTLGLPSCPRPRAHASAACPGLTFSFGARVLCVCVRQAVHLARQLLGAEQRIETLEAEKRAAEANRDESLGRVADLERQIGAMDQPSK